MFQYSEKIILNTNGIHLYEITDTVAAWIRKNEVSNGLLNISIQHTSASLLIQENADPNVFKDLINYFLNSVTLIKNINIHLKVKMICLHILRRL